MNQLDLNSEIITEYKNVLKRTIPLAFPNLLDVEIEDAINYSIKKRFKNTDISINNNYKNKNVNSTLYDICNYILSKQPIMTSQGVLFQRHANTINPLYELADGFIVERKAMKKKMFKYPKGSSDYEKYNLLQSLLKIDVNGLYGVIGQKTSLLFNLYVAASITVQGRSCISASALLFESFFNNNVPFGSFDEIITFIDNVRKETRTYNDNDILDDNISLEETFFQITTNVGFGYVPTEEEMLILWNMLSRVSQQDLNRIFYKNNLFNFMDNSSMQKSIKYILCSLKMPFLDPNTVPSEIKVELEEFWYIIKEYVYYDQQIIDRLDKLDSLIRSVVAIIDTDSTILSFDGWYHYILDCIKDIDSTQMPIKKELIDVVKFVKRDEFGDLPLINPVEFVDTPTEYDFYNDEIIEMQRSINPLKVIPQDGLTYSIINIMGYCASQMILDYMQKYTENSNSADPSRSCLLIMKNEFYFGRLFLTDAKKNYASTQLLQEGNKIPVEESLDVKGLPAFTKSTMNAKTRTQLKKILYETIMTPNEIDQLHVLKELAKVEKQMYNSIQNGEKEYYKPARIKSISAYENPMRIQGIKASLAYNSIKEPENDAINLEERNSVIIIKCIITPKNASQIITTYPDVYRRMIELMKRPEYDGEISAIAIPLTEEVPKWILPFVDYTNIISDNVSLFPLESIGIYRGNDNNNHTNILQL